VSELELDAMTKAELLDHARSIGASPANNDMTKEELRASIEAATAEPSGEEAEPEEQLGPEEQVTTTMTKDFLGVLLVNPTPGTSNATDRLGRSVLAGNKDYLGRNLVA
jgi:hypothetical protein